MPTAEHKAHDVQYSSHSTKTERQDGAHDLDPLLAYRLRVGTPQRYREPDVIASYHIVKASRFAGQEPNLTPPALTCDVLSVVHPKVHETSTVDTGSAMNPTKASSQTASMQSPLSNQLSGVKDSMHVNRPITAMNASTINAAVQTESLRVDAAVSTDALFVNAKTELTFVKDMPCQIEDHIEDIQRAITHPEPQAHVSSRRAHGAQIHGDVHQATPITQGPREAETEHLESANDQGAKVTLHAPNDPLFQSCPSDSNIDTGFVASHI